MTRFLEVSPTVENYRRALVLLGRNTASYKFTLAKALLELKSQPGDLLKLEDLALPFATSICWSTASATKVKAASCTSGTGLAAFISSAVSPGWTIRKVASSSNA
jgi:hypothetical protein